MSKEWREKLFVASDRDWNSNDLFQNAIDIDGDGEPDEIELDGDTDEVSVDKHTCNEEFLTKLL